VHAPRNRPNVREFFVGLFRIPRDTIGAGSRNGMNCKYRSWAVWTMLCMLLTAVRLFAQEARSIPDEVVEPILTEETLPEEPGECDLRTSIDYRASNLEPANALPRLQFFCGLVSRWGIELDVPLAFPDHQLSRTGFGDVASTFKYRLTGVRRKIPVVVLGMETSFPRGNLRRGTGEEGFELQPFVALLTQGSRLGLQGNIGIGFPAGSPEQAIRTYCNLAATLRLTSGRVYFIGESNASHASGGDTILSLSPGIHYGITQRVYVAFASPVHVRGGVGRAGIVIQIQFRLNRERRSE